MKRILFFAAMLTMMNLNAQNDWKKFDELMDKGSYKSAYAHAESVYEKSSDGAVRLAAAYHMTLAAEHYQEDVHDSAEARYRRLLPQLPPLEKALCHSFLGEHDSALAQADVLKQTPVEQIKMYCTGNKNRNMTPTAYDVLCIRAQEEGDCTPQQRVELQRGLVELHRNDNDDVSLWHELRLLEKLEEVPNQPLLDNMILELLDRYRESHSPLVTKLHERMAYRCASRGEYNDALRWCDSAIAHAPQSEGGVQCDNLKNEILMPRIIMNTSCLTFVPGQPSLQRVRYRNLGRLWFRVLPYDRDHYYHHTNPDNLAKVKPIKQWDMDVPGNKDCRFEEVLFALPALDAGHYSLLVSPTESLTAEGFVVYELNVTDMYLIQNKQQGLLLDRATGRPIANQTLSVVSTGPNNMEKLKMTTKTDKDGRYCFDSIESKWSDLLVIERNGYRLQTRYESKLMRVEPSMLLHGEMRIDRPIYRPGDTVQLAVVLYRSDGVEAQVADGLEVSVKLYDPNGKEVATDSLVTDEYGMVHTSFVIPTDRLAGMYDLKAKAGEITAAWASVRVEEYKQPKFMVTLDAATGVAPAFGSPAAVNGMAASYSAVPVSGARVQYTVVRRQLGHWWWRWWGVVNETEVLTGETATAADGTFTIVFTPEPDSSVELSTKPTFEYEVRVDVTDLNGESHPATTQLRVGYQSAFLSLEPGSTMQDLRVRYTDINGNPLPGKPTVQVELLRQPDRPLLDHPLVTAGLQSLVPDDQFRKRFPLTAPNAAYNDMSRWPGTLTTDYSHSGVYRITLSAPGADTVTEYITHTPQEARKVNSQKVMWVEVDKTTAEVGESVTLRFGSRFHDVNVYYMLRVGNDEHDFRRIVVSDELRSLTIPVDASMLGGFRVDMVAVVDGIEEFFAQHIDVPFSHKRLNVEVSTFRDKLLPGEQEEWTIKVTSDGQGTASVLMLTMYDDALNSYGGRSWGFSPWRSNWGSNWSTLHLDSKEGNSLRGFVYKSYTGNYPSVWALKEALPYFNPYRYGIRYKTTSARNAARTFLVEEVAVEPMQANVTEISADEAEAAEAEISLADKGGEAVIKTSGSEQEVQVRTNLNTLAFFAPALRTGDDGTATYRFTVPELLTSWNVRGLAVTRDIKIGTLDKKLITQKPLMVQPNMPRFLRSGDSLSLMAKVMNLSGEEQHCTVDFLLTDAATGDTLCSQRQHVAVKEAAQVMFSMEVPQNVYVATYRIVASADGMSDGEQGQVPVVTNRQAVTISRALYINGVGEKHFRMPEWLAASDSRQPHLLAAELTSNPAWLAVKVMPYVQDLRNPSTLYLANQLYVNRMGANIIESLGLLDNLELQGKLTEHGVSRLTMNEDVKQTLLQATPWVRAAESEEEQMEAVKRYFDTATLNAALQTLSSELCERQNADGGWSWMPEGESSVWVTQQVLQRVRDGKSVDGHVADAALDYIDREHQQRYERYIKPYLKKGYQWESTDIDYLYTRSFYGKANTEAYKFYYGAALKGYKSYENLYTQAQLALIFHRHGDRKQALDLLRRLKEKSLENDEMGLYWRDNQAGWYWYSRPIETQAMLIQAFAEIAPKDTVAIGQMQQWLLKQKQTTHWGNERATTEAIAALMVNAGAEGTAGTMGKPGPTDATADTPAASLQVFGTPLTGEAVGMEGYRQQRWSGSELDSVRALGSDDIVVSKRTRGIAWGAVYYQFTDDMDKIPSTDMGITVKRSYRKVEGGKTSGKQVVATEAGRQPDVLRVGDRIKVRVDIQCDRAMDYLELVDGRPSCVDPISTRAGWRWNNGLSYYITVNQTDTRCYIEHLNKGKYWFEYEVYVTNPGHFLTGPLTMQCMYAPEFRATAPAQQIEIRED